MDDEDKTNIAAKTRKISNFGPSPRKFEILEVNNSVIKPPFIKYYKFNDMF